MQLHTGTLITTAYVPIIVESTPHSRTVALWE